MKLYLDQPCLLSPLCACLCVSCTKPSHFLCRQTDTRDGRSDAVAAVRNQQVRRAEPCTPHLTPPAHANTVSCMTPMWSTSGACWVASVTAAQPNVAHHCGGAAHPGQHTRVLLQDPRHQHSSTAFKYCRPPVCCGCRFQCSQTNFCVTPCPLVTVIAIT